MIQVWASGNKLAVSIYGEEDNLFFSYALWPLVGCPCPRGQPHSHSHVLALIGKEEDMKLGGGGRCWGLGEVGGGVEITEWIKIHCLLL